MKRIVVLAMLASLPGLAHAQGPALHARTAGDLADLCSQSGKEPAGAAKLNFCLGYAQATFDAELKHAAGKKPFCLPSPAPTRMATMVDFASWVKSSGGGSAQSQEALLRYMGQKYPCK